MRRWLNFEVEGVDCAATLDDGDDRHGLLIVSGGNEIRCGAHRGMARLAAEIAAEGHPVLRFDRRGIGDSAGTNGGFESSAPDIAGALDAFYAACPNLCTVTAFGNCDAAAALLLHRPLPDRLSFLILANPWTIDEAVEAEASGSLPPPAAIRSRYAARLRDGREWRRLLRGGVDLHKLARGIRAALRRPAPASTPLAARIARALHAIDDRNVTILLADGDRTADAFSALWNSAACDAPRARPWVQTHRHSGGSHSFATVDARAWLKDQVLAAIRR